MIAVLLAVFGTYRISPIDVPEHLAVGRWIWEQGQPMTTNTLSWSYPDYPNVQQYPLYQITIHLLLETFGFASLSIFCAVTWVVATATWVGWAGGPARAASLPVVWLLAVVGVQRHLVPRPEVATLLGLGVLLLLFDRWRADPTRRLPLPGMVVTLWLMVNSHQMYILGAGLIAGFAIHVALSKRLHGTGWLDTSDADLPLPPLLVTLAAAVGAMALGPIGLRAWIAPWELVTTVLSFGGDGEGAARSAELEPIWTDPLGGPITAMLLVAVGVAGWRSRGRWSVLDLGVLAMGFGLVALALRGIPFFAVAAAAVITRWEAKAPDRLVPEDSIVHAAGALSALLIAGSILYGQLRPQEYVYLHRQQGLGRSVGDWGDHVASFLREHPPPGEMMNIGWVAANYLNYGVFPVRRVFVDGRWEAYPKEFLLRTIAGESDQDVLDGLIAEWNPGFVVAEMRDPNQQQRVATLMERGWTLVFVDSIAVVVVPPGPATAAYRAAWGSTCAEADLPDWLPDHRILYAQQQIRFASFLDRCGEAVRAEKLFAEAEAHADHPAVARDLDKLR